MYDLYIVDWSYKYQRWDKSNLNQYFYDHMNTFDRQFIDKQN